MSLSILLLYKNTQGVNSHGLVGGLLPIVNDKIAGLLSGDVYKRVNLINANFGLYGGSQTTWYRIGKYNYHLISAIIMYMFYGNSDSISKSKFEIAINFAKENSVIIQGNAGSVVGYAHTSDGKVELYVKVSQGVSFAALVAGGNIDNTDRYTTTTEPVGIVYIP